MPLRKNHNELFIRVIKKGKLQVSPEYYMKNAVGQDEEILTEEDYNIGVQKARDIFKGKFASIMKPLRSQIKECIREMEFEQAEILQQKLEFIKEYRASSGVENPKLGDLDVFTICHNESQAFVNYLQVRQGAIIQTKSVAFEISQDESEEDLLVSAIIQLQKKFKSYVQEVIVPFPVTYPNMSINVTVPKKGIKKKLLNLSRKNLDYFIDKTQNLAIETEQND